MVTQWYTTIQLPFIYHSSTIGMQMSVQKIISRSQWYNSMVPQCWMNGTWGGGGKTAKFIYRQTQINVAHAQ